MRRARACAALLLAAALARCSDTNSPVSVASVIILPDSVVAGRGDTLRFTAAVFDAHGNPVAGHTVTWSSSDTAVVAVGSAGVGIAREVGTAWVRASVDGRSDSAATHVYTPVASISVTPNTLTTVPGASFTPVTVVIDSAGDTVPATRARWLSSAPSVATVADSGTLSALDTGVAEITARRSGGADSLALHVARIRFASVAAGRVYSACGVDTAGSGYCWGFDLDGELGDGVAGIERNPWPIGIAGQLTLTAVTGAPAAACALTIAGTAYCWGPAGGGVLGDTSITQSTPVPVPVSGGHVFVTLVGGPGHTCALTGSGEAWCWGGQNFYGEDGGGQAAEAAAPIALSTSLLFTAVAAGGRHTCGIATDSATYCVGDGSSGQLGGFPTTYSLQRVNTTDRFTAIGAGDAFTCALGSDSLAYCWGANDEGQAGDTGAAMVPLPASILGGHKFLALAVGTFHTCGIEAGTRSAWCWGSNAQQAIGTTGSYSGVPVLIGGGHAWAALSAGEHLTCGVDLGGIAWCWGTNGFGALGDGTHGSVGVATPQRVLGQP